MKIADKRKKGLTAFRPHAITILTTTATTESTMLITETNAATIQEHTNCTVVEVPAMSGENFFRIIFIRNHHTRTTTVEVAPRHPGDGSPVFMGYTHKLAGSWDRLYDRCWVNGQEVYHHAAA